MDADHPGLNRAFAAAAKHGLPVNLLCWGILDKGLPHIRQHPDTVIVIDHLGLLQPYSSAGPRRRLGRSAEAARPGAIRRTYG